jgi:broad specificity phosphatase PhoE
VLVVGHGMFLLYLLLNALNLSILEGKYYHLSNASVSQLAIDSKGKIKSYHVNDYHHLIAEGLKNTNN